MGVVRVGKGVDQAHAGWISACARACSPEKIVGGRLLESATRCVNARPFSPPKPTLGRPPTHNRTHSHLNHGVRHQAVEGRVRCVRKPVQRVGKNAFDRHPGPHRHVIQERFVPPVLNAVPVLIAEGRGRRQPVGRHRAHCVNPHRFDWGGARVRRERGRAVGGGGGRGRHGGRGRATGVGKGRVGGTERGRGRRPAPTVRQAGGRAGQGAGGFRSVHWGIGGWVRREVRERGRAAFEREGGPAKHERLFAL